MFSCFHPEMRPQLVKNGEPEEEETALIAALLSGKWFPKQLGKQQKSLFDLISGGPPPFFWGVSRWSRRCGKGLGHQLPSIALFSQPQTGDISSPVERCDGFCCQLSSELHLFWIPGQKTSFSTITSMIERCRIGIEYFWSLRVNIPLFDGLSCSAPTPWIFSASLR